MTAQFKFRAKEPIENLRAKATKLANELSIPNFMARVLVARGIEDAKEATDFMNPSLDRDWRNPYEIKDLYEAVSIIEAAIKAKKRIVIYGDFDVDGITSTTVMTRAIRDLGGTALPFIPSRFAEGYGLSEDALNRVKELNGDLLVTVDCGISCKEEVEFAKQLGLDVVITDHHEAGANIPEGVPVVDPKADDGNPSAILAGVGVALKVVQALGARFNKPHLWREYTDFATLGTVADLMPLVHENRALVADGVKRMRENPRPCIAALAAVAGTPTKTLSSTSLSFSLIPRINAAGRMDEVELALHLMLSDDYEDAVYLAEELDMLNSRRREIESDLTAVATAIAEKDYSGERAIIVAGEGWHEGIKGIVASKLCGQFGVPSLLFSIEGDVARGSGRSVGNVNLYEAVESTSDMLTKFGGHSAAVGVTLPVANLDAFHHALNEYMQALPEEEFLPKCEIDALIDLEELDLQNVEQLEKLAPFGNCNPAPVFLAKNVMIEDCRAVGSDKNHLSCVLSDGAAKVKAIMFHCDNIASLLETTTVANAAFTVQVDEWRGKRSVKANLEEIVTSKCCSGLDACLDSGVSGYLDDLYSEGTPNVATRHKDAERYESQDTSLMAYRKHWEKLANDDPASLKGEIIKALIGNQPLRKSQKDALDLLDKGKSVLCIMGTGRGKSLIFQAHAVYTALARKKCSVFVYPLRALMADQAFHMQRSFDRFGIVCKVLNGQTPQEERKRTYNGISEGEVDIVLTTPEYLFFHAGEIACEGRIGFVVIDEAHHIAQAKAGQRPSYAQLKAALDIMGNPQVLAVTATSNSEMSEQIERDLGITNRVIDESQRDNLHIDDKRNLSSRDDYLAHIVASGEKCVIYVNSREQSVNLARNLRSKVLNLAPMIGFYNAGLPREDRERVEELFREGAIRTLVATSAFGEGVDIPDIRHVVLYHMPFSEVEFNQMAGRAGRDGKKSYIHLLYGKNDASINKSILSHLAPDRDTMAQVYRHLRNMQKTLQDDMLRFSFASLAKDANRGRAILDEEIVACGIRVFSELGLIDVREMPSFKSDECVMSVCDVVSKVELSDSTQYREGLCEIANFLAFKDWALKSDCSILRARVIRPISPNS